MSITTFHPKGVDEEEYNEYDKRNEMLEAFFHANGIGEIRLLGVAMSPVIIYEESLRLACYTKDYNLILMDKVGGKVISVIAFDTERVLNAETLLIDFIESSEHDPVYKIELSDLPGLYLGGYKYINKETYFGKQPIFSVLEPRIFLNYNDAKEVIEKFPEYKLTII